MNEYPGYIIIIRLDPHLVPHYMDTIPTWFTKLKVDVVNITCRKIKNEVEIQVETRWDAHEFAVDTVVKRLQATRALRNIRLVNPVSNPNQR